MLLYNAAAAWQLCACTASYSRFASSASDLHLSAVLLSSSCSHRVHCVNSRRGEIVRATNSDTLMTATTTTWAFVTKETTELNAVRTLLLSAPRLIQMQTARQLTTMCALFVRLCGKISCYFILCRLFLPSALFRICLSHPGNDETWKSNKTKFNICVTKCEIKRY